MTTKPSISADAPANTGEQSVARESKADLKVYADIYRVLLAGMVVSTALFVVGIILGLLHPTYLSLSPASVRRYYSWPVLLHGLATLDPMAIMLVATALLILTPVTRVLVSIYAFLTERDRKFVAVTSIVFAVMVATVILGLLGLK